MTKVFSRICFCQQSRVPLRAQTEKEAFLNLCRKRAVTILNDSNTNENDESILYLHYRNGWQANGENISSLNSLFEDGVLAPNICIRDFDQITYKSAVADWQAYAHSKMAFEKRKLDLYMMEKLNLVQGAEDAIEWLTGGVFFYDYEWYALGDDPLKKLFEEKDLEGSNRFLLQLDDKVLLRGPDIYYYYSCYISRYEKPTIDQINIWFFFCDKFLTALCGVLPSYRRFDSFGRRLLLSVLDNIRNIILLMANSEFLIRAKGQSSCLLIDESFEWFPMIDQYQKLYWTLLSGDNIQKNLQEIIDLCQWVRDHLPAMKQGMGIISDAFILSKCFNPLREVDNYFENHIVLSQIAAQMEESNQPTNLIGVAYGGLELPYILRRIRGNEQDKIFIVFQNNGMYLDKQKKNSQYAYQNLSVPKGLEMLRSNISIMIDENIMSGLTMQLIMNDFALKGIYCRYCAVIRHPCLNRVEQLLHHNLGVNVDLFGSFVLGGLAPTPYTKIKSGTNYADMFTDELYIFSSMTEVFLKGLYKNNSFIQDSEVDIFRGFSPGHKPPSLLET